MDLPVHGAAARSESTTKDAVPPAGGNAAPSMLAISSPKMTTSFIRLDTPSKLLTLFRDGFGMSSMASGRGDTLILHMGRKTN
jgi:hypothetical protein